MTLHHEDGPDCRLCQEKLNVAHPKLGDWFREVKARYINVHISWSWRGPDEQNKLLAEKKTNRPWPESAHNAVNEKHFPCSRALDLFQIDEDGVARFSAPFYAKLAAEVKERHEPIVWGGDWLGDLGDKDHFELEKDLV